MPLNLHKVEEALFSLEDCITMPEAEKLLRAQGFDVLKQTLINWCKQYPIGVKVGGRWYVNPDKLSLLLQGKLTARANYVPAKKEYKKKGEKKWPVDRGKNAY